MPDMNKILLHNNGFKIGPRDPKVNPESPGEFQVVNDDHEWALVGDDLSELIAGTVDHFELAPQTLESWDPEDGTSVEYLIEQEAIRVDLLFETGASIWIEVENGEVRVHCYAPGEDEPVSVSLGPDSARVSP